ncbi:MAG: methyltransferase domain-containing protein, partial [Deltaproteobacteria bacterium]|nr:methyltransferase domain-containing protein [Deltaproteobacteria bacterium]
MEERVTANLLLTVSPSLSWFGRREEVYCYHDLIGYILQMSGDIHELVAWFGTPHTAAEAVEEFGRLLPEQMVQEIVETLKQHRCLLPPGEDDLGDFAGWVPVKAKWRVACTAPDGMVTLVLSRTASEVPRFRSLDREESVIWGLLDGLRTAGEVVAEAALRLGRPEEELRDATRRALASWTHHGAQVVKLHEVPLSFYKGRMHALPPYLTSTMPFPSLGGGTLLAAAGRSPVVDLRDYHRRHVVDPQLQFDEVETTLNHLFRRPHRALQGRTYPGQMASVLAARGLLPAAGQVVEIGGGTGSFAEGFWQALQQEHPERAAALRYTVVELSPALAEHQRRLLAPFGERVQVQAGDAESLDLPAESVDLLIANEMIGDLRSALVTQDDLDLAEHGGIPKESSLEAVELIRSYGLPVGDAPPRFFLNLGALRLLEHVARVLRPGGVAVLTEFGERHAYPCESDHLDHAEFSIHFGHLIHVAHLLGLSPEFEFLMDFLEMDRNLQTLATTRPQL